MTATSGDALSHVNFQTRQNAVLTQIGMAEFQPLASGKTRGPLPSGASVPAVFAWRL
jgi:hypothetical protein